MAKCCILFKGQCNLDLDLKITSVVEGIIIVPSNGDVYRALDKVHIFYAPK